MIPQDFGASVKIEWDLSGIQIKRIGINSFDQCYSSTANQKVCQNEHVYLPCARNNNGALWDEHAVVVVVSH